LSINTDPLPAKKTGYPEPGGNEHNHDHSRNNPLKAVSAAHLQRNSPVASELQQKNLRRSCRGLKHEKRSDLLRFSKRR